MLLPYYNPEHVSAFDAEEHHANNAPKLIGYFTLFITVCFFIATPIGVIYSNEHDFFGNLFRILTSPSKLVTDYFALGGLGSTFFNAAICGLATNFIIIFSGIKAKATTFAGYMLVVAHCFYGLNFLNMWPTIFGVLLYCAVCKKKFSDNVHIALFSTALGPFISDFIFRYVPLFQPEGIPLNATGGNLADTAVHGQILMIAESPEKAARMFYDFHKYILLILILHQLFC